MVASSRWYARGTASDDLSGDDGMETGCSSVVERGTEASPHTGKSQVTSPAQLRLTPKDSTLCCLEHGAQKFKQEHRSGQKSKALKIGNRFYGGRWLDGSAERAYPSAVDLALFIPI